jgi:hypothetical protein
VIVEVIADFDGMNYKFGFSFLELNKNVRLDRGGLGLNA